MVPLDGLGVNWLTTSDLFSYENNIYRTLLTHIQTIAVGGKIHDIMRLQKQFGLGRWRKLKGIANLRLSSREIQKAEIHWYEAHGIGKRKFKIKRLIGGSAYETNY